MKYIKAIIDYCGNSVLLITLIGSILGTTVASWYVERRKKKEKKKLLLLVLHTELSKYKEPSTFIIRGERYYRTPLRSNIIWNILTSDILDINLDKHLINSLYEIISWVENFNYINDLANQSALSDKSNKLLNESRDSLYMSAFKEIESLLLHLKNKYKIA